ncbi:hypothetical protein TSUD_122070 [Trifolium subterraneum]|nr:hypothetical protein TSUD_122070 [Trifolium subterraneum]
MAAKLLHSLADDNQDLQKQIGCNLHFNDGSFERDSDSIQHQQQMATESSLNRGLNDKQRISTESSRASFSSCSSSVSSLDFKAEVETSFETPTRDTFMNQPAISPRFGRHSLDLRDVVKDSMYRDPRGPSAKSTAKDQSSVGGVKHRDSPRPLQMSKYADRSYGVEIDEKQSVPIDLKESIRVLSKLREAPWNYTESTRELPRSSHEVRDGHWNSVSKDAPWLAYDGRETSRLSFESRETIKSTPKLKEFPRHSLDSKEGSWRNYNSDSRPSNISRNAYGATSTSNEKFSSPQQSSSAQNRLPSVVAKLMGLEALPDSSSVGDTQSGSTETYSAQDNGQFPRPSKNGFIRPLRVSNSPKISLKDPTSPRRKNPDVVMKPVSSSKFPIEPAPWKQHDANRNSQKQILRTTKVPLRTQDSFPSVYSEIEKRLKDLEFKQSGRDLRALKQILEAMQEKGLLESRKEEQVPNVVGSRSDYEPKASNLNQNSRLAKQQNPQRNNFLSSTFKGNDSARAFDSPIVIMKPAKLVEKSEISASSAIPIGGFSGSNNRNNISSTLLAREQSPKNIRRDASPSSTDKKTSITKTTRSLHIQSRSNQFPKESQSSGKSSGSVSPRLQQKKLELEKRSRLPTPPSDSNKPRRQSSKKAAESVSPGGKVRHKTVNSQNSEEQLSEISNDSRSFYQGDEISVQSDSITVDSKLDIEVTSSLRSSEIDDSQSPSLKAMKKLVSETVQKKSTPRLDQDETIAELASMGPEHPSPNSVLDASVYKDDVQSPVVQTPNDPKAGNAQESKDGEAKDQWKPDDNLSFNSTGSGEINRKKLQSIDHLVQKLRRLNSNHDEARNDYIASLCENSNPDHRYISEILLASGLLLRDLNSEFLTFQLHSSGHPINPELFLVLEQTKASSLLSKEESSFGGKAAFSKQTTEKFHRKLLFDAVNEILVAKLGYSPEPWFQPNKLTKKNLSSQKLLKELCFEIEKVQAKKTECCLEDDDEEDDGLKSMLCEDVIHGSVCWEDFNGEIPGIVLDVERLIFKDLVNDIVIGEASGLRVKSSVRRRKLFGK